MTIRHIGKRASALHSLQYFGYYSCLVSFILMLFAPSQRSVMPKDPVFLIALLVVGGIILVGSKGDSNHLVAYRLAYLASWPKYALHLAFKKRKQAGQHLPPTYNSHWLSCESIRMFLGFAAQLKRASASTGSSLDRRLISCRY